MIDAKTLGRRIKYFRKRAGLSQMDLELAMNASAGMISRIESGKVNPSKETIRNIAAIFELNSRELDYLAGTISSPATEEEIQKAIKKVEEYFNRNDVFAYLLDERWRMLYVSKNVERMLKILRKVNKSITKKYYKYPLLDALLNPEYGTVALFPEDEIDGFLGFQFSRFQNEVGFMQDDESYKKVVDMVNSVPRYKKVWDKTQAEGFPPSSYASRRVVLKVAGMRVKLNYSREMLAGNPRFETIEMFPNNKFLSLLIRGKK